MTTTTTKSTTKTKTTALNKMESEPPTVPSEFICPITQEIMIDPLVSRYGNSFERTAIIQWLAKGDHCCPLTRQPLSLTGLVTNHRLRARIRDWQVQNEMDLSLLMKPQDDDAVCAFLTLDDTTERTCTEEDDDDEVQGLRETNVTVQRVDETAAEEERRRHEERRSRRRSLWGMRRGNGNSSNR